MRNQLNHGFKRRKRLPTPIDGNIGKESMLDLVPFACGWRQMANGNSQTRLIGQVLYLLFPEPIARPVRATTISHDQEFCTGWIQFAANALPPPSDALDRKLGGLMVNPHVDEAAILQQIIDPIGDRFAISDGEVIIDVDRRLLPAGLPFSSAVLEIPDEFFLLTIDGNDRLPLGFKSFARAIDVLKLGIPVGMRGALNPLLVGFE